MVTSNITLNFQKSREQLQQIYEALLKHGALDAVRLRRESHLSTDANKPRFEKALTDLQAGLKVLPIGIAPVGAWRYAFIYEILPRWLPGIPDRARSISRIEARRHVLDRYLHNVIASPLAPAARLFRWTLAEARQAAEALAADGRIDIDVKVAGLRDLQLVASPT